MVYGNRSSRPPAGGDRPARHGRQQGRDGAAARGGRRSGLPRGRDRRPAPRRARGRVERLRPGHPSGLPHQSMDIRFCTTRYGTPCASSTISRSRADVDGTRIGMIGISKGGMETYLAAAADPRIAVAVPAIGVQSFALGAGARRLAGPRRNHPRAPSPARRATASHLSTRSSCGTSTTASCRASMKSLTRPAMLPLIAPRPLLVVNGDSDALTPLAGVEEAAAAAERAYRSAGAPEKFRLLVQPDTGHEFTAGRAARRLAGVGHG